MLVLCACNTGVKKILMWSAEGVVRGHLKQSQLFILVLSALELARRGYDIAMDAVAGLTYLHDLNCAHLVCPIQVPVQ